jgi:hypothetical protein
MRAVDGTSAEATKGLRFDGERGSFCAVTACLMSPPQAAAFATKHQLLSEREIAHIRAFRRPSFHLANCGLEDQWLGATDLAQFPF